MNKHTLLVAFALSLTAPPAIARAADDEAIVKVFILAGQSNMEGKAKNDLFNYQAEASKTKEQFTHLRTDGKWIVRDDVFIKFLGREGPLTIGYGSPGCTGVEFEFGTMMGNHYEAPVLLIKTAWGGHSLFKLFRSPSALMPSYEVLQQELEKARDRVKKNNEKRNRNDPLPKMADITDVYGRSYRNMLTEVNETLANYGTMFPAIQGKKLEIAGFVWFQGWNDMYGGAEQEYASNMKYFIRDVRQDLHAPNMPFVIGVMGQNGSKPAKGAMLTIQEAQLATQRLPEFKGNVKAVRTDVLVDKAAEELYPTWRENVQEWERTGSNFGYHYLGSAIWFNRIGHAMGESMLELLESVTIPTAYAINDGTSAVYSDEKPVRILFVGNSYTRGVRGVVEQTLAALPVRHGTQMEFVSPGGRQLHQHLANDKLMQRIDKGKWDYVVLQEQSQMPSLPPPYSDDFFKASKTLCERIREAGAKPVFFMTWGRRDGDKQNIAVNPDFTTMQRNLSKSYRRSAKENKALLLPVGDVFSELYKQDKNLWKQLYKGDGSHPSDKGAAVFSCVLLHTLWGNDLGTVKIRGVDGNELAEIKAATKSVKRGS